VTVEGAECGLDAKLKFPHLGLCLLALLTDHFSEAEQEIQTAINLEVVEEFDTAFTLGLVRAVQGEIEGSRTALEKASGLLQLQKLIDQLNQPICAIALGETAMTQLETVLPEAKHAPGLLAAKLLYLEILEKSPHPPAELEKITGAIKNYLSSATQQ
jgi:hypothetical protein